VELTLVSYNIRSGIGMDGAFDLERVVSVIRELSPDVVALQEVGDFRGVTDAHDHPERLAAATGLQLAFGPNVVHGRRSYGNALLSRLPIQGSHNYDLSVEGKEPRGALRCDLALPDGGLLHVFCLHLGLTAKERRAQEALLLSADIMTDAARKDPVVVCGDFNYWWIRPMPFKKVIRDCAIDLGRRRPTYPSRLPLLRLDRVYVDRWVEPVAMKVHRSKMARVASDHLPLWVRLRTTHARPAVASPPVQLIG
jgi:endonuclease/exonuclease/phosphatase family metal-dependent hydrolase